MRILYSFPHPIGAPGIGTTAMQEVVGLLERGHDVTVIATSAHKGPRPLPQLLSTMALGGVRVPHRVLGMDNSMAYHDARVARHLRTRRGAYDVVHCWPGATLATARVAAKLGIPSVREVPNTHTENAYEVVGQLCEGLGIELPPGSSHRLDHARLAREKAEYEAAFRLLVPSDFVADSFRVRGFSEEKLLRHRYGFDPTVFQPLAERAPGPLRALFLGGVGPRKGLHIALEAWARSKASKQGRFAIYGRLEDGYQPVIEPYLNAPGVEMHEFTSDVSGALQASDVLLLPSFEEGSALVTYEAQGCGVIPLVSAAAGAMCVDGVTGLVHDAGDVAALTAHLDLLHAEPARRDQMRLAILERRDTLTWAAAAERLEACYEAACGAAKRARDGQVARDRAAAPTGTTRSEPHDLVFTFWHETWTDSVQRQFMTPDRLAQMLVKHPAVGKLLIANPYRMGPSQLVRKLQARHPAPLPARPYATGLVSPLRLRRKDATGEKALRATYAAYDRRLRRAAAKMGLRQPAVITTNPFYAAYGPLNWAGPVTYYAFDDWAAYDAHERWWPDYVRAYAEIRRRGHAVCAVSRHLLNRIDPTGPGLVVPNGIVPEEWQPPWRAPAWLAALPRPHILYTGAIHNRLDLGAVRDLANRFPNGSILFVGPISHPEVANELKQIRGVHLRDSLSRPLVAGLTRAVDVCIMPHHRTALTESMSPLKIYEYCAAGRPSAATDIPPVRGIHSHVVLVPEGASFADGVERALALGPMPEADRQKFVQENAWRGRHDAMLAVTFRE
jgi:glycosyltransferase involved in cell wall biosynthesis